MQVLKEKSKRKDIKGVYEEITFPFSFGGERAFFFLFFFFFLIVKRTVDNYIN